MIMKAVKLILTCTIWFVAHNIMSSQSPRVITETEVSHTMVGKFDSHLIYGTESLPPGIRLTIDFEISETDDYVTYKFVTLAIDGQDLFSISISNGQLVVSRLVRFQECQDWTSSACISWGTETFGRMHYKTWDDDFVLSKNRLRITLAHNGLKIDNINTNGDIISDLSYAGIYYDSGIYKKIRDTNFAAIDYTFEHEIIREPSILAGLLTYVKLEVGNIAAIVENEDTNPETNYPNSDHGPKNVDKKKDGDVLEEDKYIASKDILFFPNPTREELYLNTSFKEDLDTQLIIYDLAGRALVNIEQRIGSGSQRTKFNLRKYSLPQGVYALQFNYGGDIDTSKLVID